MSYRAPSYPKRWGPRFGCVNLLGKYFVHGITEPSPITMGEYFCNPVKILERSGKNFFIKKINPSKRSFP